MEHVNDWCFRDIYQGGLWKDDLYVRAQKLIHAMTDNMFLQDVDVIYNVILMPFDVKKQKWTLATYGIANIVPHKKNNA